MTATASYNGMARVATACQEPIQNIAYIYDGSTEGLLTAVFMVYANHENPQDVVREGILQPRLGQSTLTIETDNALAKRVQAGIRKRGGKPAWEIVLEASLSDEPDVGTLIYRFIRLIMSRSAARNARIPNELTDPVVGPVLKLQRFVRNERHHMQQFLRFEHFEGGLWFAKCNPNANVVPLLMDWFSGRFNTQRFVIYDEVHHVAGIYDGVDWWLAQTNSLHLPSHTEEERLMQTAWKDFYKAVSISARYHPELRRQFMPKRFWKNILEVRDELPNSGLRALPENDGNAFPAAALPDQPKGSIGTLAAAMEE
jgi:probable DNA metabolism protein